MFRQDKVEIYGRDNCTYCTKAKELCEKQKVPYTYFDVSTEGGQGDITVEEFKEMFPQQSTIPQIKINGTWIGGYRQLQAEYSL